MGVACDLFSCKHTNGVVEDVQNYVTPYDPRIQELARDLRYDPDTMYRYARDMPYKLDADGEGDKWYKPVETLDRGVKDCLTGDTEVITLKDGLYAIQTMEELYKNPDCLILSYDFVNFRFEFQPITQVVDKGCLNAYEVSLRNGTSFRCTSNHELFVYNKRWKRQIKGANNMTMSRYGGVWLKQRQVTDNIRTMYLSDLDNDLSSITQGFTRQLVQSKKIPTLGKDGISHNQLWLEGMYVAEGWSEISGVSIANDNPMILANIEQNLSELGVSFRRSKRKKSAYIKIHSSDFSRHLKKFGAKSMEKKFINERLSLSEDDILILLGGYITGDGHLNKPYFANGGIYRRKRTYMTVSPELVKQLKFISMVLGRHFNYYSPPKPDGFGKLKQHYLYEYDHKKTHREIYPSLTSESVKGIEETGKERVYDITVAKNHNFVLADTGTIVHNCLDGSVLLNSLLIASGYNSWTSLVYLPLSDEFHANVQAVINNELVTLETTCPSCKIGELPGEPVLKILDFNDTGLLAIHEDSVLAS